MLVQKVGKLEATLNEREAKNFEIYAKLKEVSDNFTIE